MDSPSHKKVGRNDLCPCGSGKKYKRCCLLNQPISQDRLWTRQRAASDDLTRDMMRFAARKFGTQIDEAWQDFNMSDLPEASVDRSTEDQIFMPYFLFHWDPLALSRRRGALGNGGVVLRWYMLERATRLTEMERMFLHQATTQPVSFHEVLENKPGVGMTLRDVMIGSESHVVERSASGMLRPGDIVYAQVWNLTGLAILGCCAPLCIPPGRKADVIALRKKLQKRAARQKRDLSTEDLICYAVDIRTTYLDIRDSLYAPPQFCNTDGDPLEFHTLTFHIESAEAAFHALASLALTRTKDDLLEDAEFDRAGNLNAVTFEWLKKGNRKISTWDNTIMGTIRISANSLTAKVNSAKRAVRIRAEIKKRLGALATHRSTLAQTHEDALETSPKRMSAKTDLDSERDSEFMVDPEVRKLARESLQKQVEEWVHQKIPVLGNRTPMQAVREPDGREIVESLLLDWERRAENGFSAPDIRPDIQSIRKLLDLASPSS
jgi:hypothetical protein